MENNYQNMDAIDRMRTRPLAWMNILLVVANILIFVLVEITGSTTDTANMLLWGASYVPYVVDGREYWRLFTSMFLHFGIQHLFNNMLLLFFLGDTLERVVGKISYLLIYLLGGLGGNILSCYVEMKNESYAVSAGASGAVFAVIGAMLYVLIRNRGRIEEMTAQRLMIMALLTLYVGFTTKGVDNMAHLGGLMCGFLLAVILYHGRHKA